MRLNSAGQLGVGERCVNADNQGVKLVVCRLGTVDGPWEYDEVSWSFFLSHRSFYESLFNWIEHQDDAAQSTEEMFDRPSWKAPLDFTALRYCQQLSSMGIPWIATKIDPHLPTSFLNFFASHLNSWFEKSIRNYFCFVLIPLWCPPCWFPLQSIALFLGHTNKATLFSWSSILKKYSFRAIFFLVVVAN